MAFRNFYKIIIGILFLFALVIGLTSINHPIVLKWITGTAKYIGRPIKAIVYTNGKINQDIKVFHAETYWENNQRANNYLLSVKYYDSSGRLKFLNINLLEKWIGSPVGTGKRDYDFILGHLFQSESGGHFVPFDDDIKGYNFDSQLSFTDSQIKFNIPRNTLKFDSVRIEFP